jgi:uncharacterized protein YecE (DUF72 family)
MGTRYHIGAKRLESNLASYAKRFDFLEVHMAPPGEPTQSLATLRRWRKQVPPHFDFAVSVGPAAASLKAGAALDKDLDAALEAADALQARWVRINTPHEVTPAAVWRTRLEKVAERLRRDATLLAWEPRGLWEAEDARRLARQLGLVLVVDPLRDPVPEGPVSYCRLRALGETRSFGTTQLERAAAAIGVRRDAYVVIETTSALAECKRLRSIAQQGTHRDGGYGTIIRPRGESVARASLRVKDDEQE